MYEDQDEATDLVVQTDREWGSCRTTRFSNSGRWLPPGRHLLLHWSRVQARVALSILSSSWACRWCDLKAIKIRTNWVVTNKKCRFAGRGFACDTKKGKLFAGAPGRPTLRSSVCRLAPRKRAARSQCVAVMDVNSAILKRQS